MNILSFLLKNKPPFSKGDKVRLNASMALNFPEFIKWFSYSSHEVTKYKRGPLRAGGWIIYLDNNEDFGVFSNYFELIIPPLTMEELNKSHIKAYGSFLNIIKEMT